jgi:hypothetical protein
MAAADGAGHYVIAAPLLMEIFGQMVVGAVAGPS